MTGTKAFLVKPDLTKNNPKFDHYLDQNWIKPDRTYQLYIPNKYIFGHFIRDKDGFKLSPGGIYFNDSSKTLEETFEHLNGHYLDIVKEISLSEQDLGKLEKLILMKKRYPLHLQIS